MGSTIEASKPFRNRSLKNNDISPNDVKTADAAPGAAGSGCTVKVFVDFIVWPAIVTDIETGSDGGTEEFADEE